MSNSRILVVEDEPIVALDLEERLAGIGYVVAGRAASGEKSIKLAQEQRPDLVLMDIRLKGDMDGIAAAEEMRDRFHLPVIFLTAYSEDETLERAKLAEPFGYLLKPCDDRELKSAIEIALYKHHAEEEIRRLNRLYDVLSQVNQAVVRIHDREELLTTICRLVVERGGADLAWIGWVDPNTSQIRPVAHFGNCREILSQREFYADDRPEGQGNSGRAVREDRPCVCNECIDGVCQYPAARTPVRFGFQSCGSFPLRFQGRVCGVLSICVAEPGFFREREIKLLEEVAMDISFALDKIEADNQREYLNQQFQRQSIFLQTLINAIPHPVFYKDHQLRYLGCNTAFEQFLGIKREQLINKTVYELWPPDLADLYHRADLELLASMGSQVYEGPLQSQDGASYDIQFHKATFQNPDGSMGGIIGVMEDITGRKQAEKERSLVEAQLRQAQKMEALGTLAGGIAHDFNNILGIIIGYTELAGLNLEGESAIKKYLQEVLNGSRRAKDLVQQILAFSRRSEQEKKPVQVGLIVKEVTKMLRSSLPSTIEIKVEVSSQAVVLADPTQIHQVLMNLCANAAHAMRDRGGMLQVSLTDIHLNLESILPLSGLQPGQYVKLIVKDTGHGVDPAILHRIFDPFFTTKEPGVGTGLGLAVVHGIVKNHGGAIEVDTQPDQGTTFQVLLPTIQSVPETEPGKTTPLSRGQGRVLVVDDEPLLAMVAKEMLEHLGYEVDYCTTGSAALESFRQNLKTKPYDLVLTDMTMPHLTGVDLARELLRLQPGLPIILCTGFSEKISEEQAKSLGIQGFLVKPVLLKQLADTTWELLNKG